jgi:hypothetical protein
MSENHIPENPKLRKRESKIDSKNSSNAHLYWKILSRVPHLMRITSDRLRLFDVENRQAMEALIDASCKKTTPSILSQQQSENVNNNQNINNTAMLSMMMNDNNPNYAMSQAMLLRQHQQELLTIDKLEDAFLKSAKKRVEIAKDAFEEVKKLLEQFNEEDEDGESDDDDDENVKQD